MQQPSWRNQVGARMQAAFEASERLCAEVFPDSVRERGERLARNMIQYPSLYPCFADLNGGVRLLNGRLCIRVAFWDKLHSDARNFEWHVINLDLGQCDRPYKPHDKRCRPQGALGWCSCSRSEQFRRVAFAEAERARAEHFKRFTKAQECDPMLELA